MSPRVRSSFPSPAFMVSTLLPLQDFTQPFQRMVEEDRGGIGGLSHALGGLHDPQLLEMHQLDHLPFPWRKQFDRHLERHPVLIPRKLGAWRFCSGPDGLLRLIGFQLDFTLERPALGRMVPSEAPDLVVDDLRKPGEEAFGIGEIPRLAPLYQLRGLEEDLLQYIFALEAPAQRRPEPELHVTVDLLPALLR